jgi:uncharacterized protein YndB with AHSA1/START domain
LACFDIGPPIARSGREIAPRDVFFRTEIHWMERAIDKDVLIDASVDRVWEAWTTRAGIVGFFSPDAEIDARVDGAFHIFMDPYAETGMKGADTMRYLALQPRTMLSFTWNAPPSLPRIREQRTVVILRFEERGAQTRLTMHQVGWGSIDGVDGQEWDATFDYFDRAWDKVLGNLQKRLAPGGTPIDWTSWLEQLKTSHEEESSPR